MNLRRLLSMVALLVLANAAHAQSPRVGLLGTAPSAATEAFEAELRRLGWTDGQNLVIEKRWMRGRPDQLPALAAELVGLNPAVILATASSQVEPLRKLTARIPIVFASHGDPVGLGHVQSLARPGGNITGVSHLMSDLNPKMLELLKEALPAATRVGVLWNPTTPSHEPALKALKAVAPQLGVQLHLAEARLAEDFAGAFAALSREQVQAVLVVAAPVTFSERAPLAELGLRHRLPTVFLYRQNAEAGGLMSYGPDIVDSLRQSASYVDKILRGAKPADLPVGQASKYDLVINLKTARAIGVSISPALLQRADQVIQ
jgi:putative ABC transport system substrate-binding protein